MKLDHLKELEPVFYNDSGVKIHTELSFRAQELCFETHWHERMELLLIKSGSLNVQIADSEISAHEGDLVIIPPNAPHTGVAGETDVRYSVIMFEMQFFYNATKASSKLLHSMTEPTAYFVPLTKNKDIINTARSLIEINDVNDAASHIITMGKIYEILGFLYRHCLTERTVTAGESRFQNVLNFIDAHYAEDISSSFLARKFGYDEAYFCRRFKTVTGLTPMSYIQIYRLEQACSLIKTTPLKIAEVSATCGFSDPSYFSRCFKRRYNITPNAYAADKRKIK